MNPKRTFFSTLQIHIVQPSLRREISKAVLPNTFIFSFAIRKDFLQRIQRSPPWRIFFNVSFMADARAGKPLSCNLIGQGENKSHYVTENLFCLGFADVIFGRTSDSRKYVCVVRRLYTWDDVAKNAKLQLTLSLYNKPCFVYLPWTSTLSVCKISRTERWGLSTKPRNSHFSIFNYITNVLQSFSVG